MRILLFVSNVVTQCTVKIAHHMVLVYIRSAFYSSFAAVLYTIYYVERLLFLQIYTKVFLSFDRNHIRNLYNGLKITIW